MSSIWYTSDLHFGHQLVSEIRGFEGVAMHTLDVNAAIYAGDPHGELDAMLSWLSRRISMRGRRTDALGV